MPRALPRRQMALDLVGQVMHVDDRALDAGVGQPVEHVVDQRLAADLDQRLRNLAVERAHARAEPGRQHHGAARSALMCGRVPPSSSFLRADQSANQIVFNAGTCSLYHVVERRQRRMRQRALQIAPYARHVTQILRLAVAHVEAREDAEDLAGALRRERDVDLDEAARRRSSDRRRAGGARSGRAARPRSPPARRRAHPAAARRDRRPPAPSRRPGSRGCRPAASSLRSGSQSRLGEWIVAQHPGRRRVDRRLQRLAPERLEGRARVVRRAATPSRGRYQSSSSSASIRNASMS